MSKSIREEEQLEQITSNFFSSIATSNNQQKEVQGNQQQQSQQKNQKYPTKKFENLTILKKTRSQSRNQHLQQQNLTQQNLQNLPHSKSNKDLTQQPSDNINDQESSEQQKQSQEDNNYKLKIVKSDNEESYGVSSISSRLLKKQYQSDQDQEDDDSDFMEDRIVKKHKNNKKEQSLQLQENNQQQQLQEVQEQQQSQIQSEKGKTIAEYVTDSLAKTSKKMRSQINSRLASKVPSRKPSQFYREDWNNDDYFEDSQMLSNNSQGQPQFNQQQLQAYSPNKRAQFLREQQKQGGNKYTTSSSFSKRPNTMNKKWNDKETQKLYRFLAIFGTDFTTIQQYLQTKTVTQIKNKFNKEEKKNPEKINEIFKNPRRRLYKKLNQIQEFEMLKNHYDNKFDLKPPQQLSIMPQSEQDLQNLENGNENNNNQQENGIFSDSKLEFQYQNKNNNGIKQQQSQQLEKDSQNKADSQLALTQKNLGLIGKIGEKEIPLMNYPKHRKDSQTSNDSVARLIEENVVQIYNKEIQLHNTNLKLIQQDSQINPTQQGQEDSDLSTNTNSHHMNHHLNNNLKNNQLLQNNNNINNNDDGKQQQQQQQQLNDNNESENQMYLFEQNNKKIIM